MREKAGARFIGENPRAVAIRRRSSLIAHKHEEAGTLGTASLLLIGQTRPIVFYLDVGLFLPY